MTKIHNIARNTSYLTLALILQKIISFTYFILLTRALGLEMMGQYYAAISFTTIFAIFIDLGFANTLTREVAKHQDKAKNWLGNVIALKIPLAIITLLVAVGTAALFGYNSLGFQLILVSSVSMILDSFTSTFFAAVRGFHNLKYESISSVIFQLIVLGLGYAALWLHLGVLAAMMVLAIASIYNFTYSLLIVRYRLGLKWQLLFEKEFIINIFHISWPFALFAIFQRFYLYIDSVMIGILANYHQVGVYQIAFKIIFALQFLPMAFTASLYPAMSSYWISNREQLVKSFERAMNYLIMISLPIIGGVIALDDKIIDIFKAGNEALWPLRISILALFFIFVNFPIGSLLNACDKQKRNLFFMASVTVISVTANFFLIPRFQAIGASITVLATNAIMFIFGIFEARKIINYNPKKNLITLGKSLWAAAVMTMIVFYGKAYMPILFATILGGILYFIFLYLVGGFKKQDIQSIISSFKR
jgi:Membrane protein involved in the export of O-antigen and teichoic acid